MIQLDLFFSVFILKLKHNLVNFINSDASEGNLHRIMFKSVRVKRAKYKINSRFLFYLRTFLCGIFKIKCSAMSPLLKHFNRPALTADKTATQGRA